VTARAAQAARRRIDGTTISCCSRPRGVRVRVGSPRTSSSKQQLFADVERLAARIRSWPATRRFADHAHRERMQCPERAATATSGTPPHLMPLVENSSKVTAPAEETLTRLFDVLAGAGSGWWWSARTARPTWQSAAARALSERFNRQEGVATVADVDTTLKYGPGLRFPAYGLLRARRHGRPGHDDGHRELPVRALSTMTQPPPFVRDLIAQGALGAKSGRGLYDWTQRSAPAVLAHATSSWFDRLRKPASAR